MDPSQRVLALGALAAASALTLCAPLAVAAPMTAHVGDEIYRADLSENLVGSGRQLKTISVRYLGLKAPGQARFERTDAKMIDDSSIHNAEPPVALPPLTTRIAVDLTSDPDLRVDGRAIRILSATAATVTYDAGQ